MTVTVTKMGVVTEMGMLCNSKQDELFWFRCYLLLVSMG